MATASTAQLHGWTHSDLEAAKREIFAAVGDISALEIFGSQILLGVYIRPVMAGSIITLNKAQREDIYQGCVSMILKFGPKALDAFDEAHFGGRKPEIGDWVFGRVADSYQTSIKGPGGEISTERKKLSNWADEGWPCRLMYPADLYGRVDLPNMIVSG